MVCAAILYISFCALHGVTHASLESTANSKQETGYESIFLHNTSEYNYMEPDASAYDLSTNGAGASSAATAHRLETAMDVSDQHAQLQQSSEDAHTPCTATHTSDASEDTQTLEYIVAIPEPKICDYLCSTLLSQSDKPHSDSLDCPGTDDIVWLNDLSQESAPIHHDVAKHLSFTDKLQKSTPAMHALRCVNAQTAFINQLLACKRANGAVPDSDGELQRLYEETGMQMCSKAVGAAVRLHFGAQLLISGLYSYITADIAAELYLLNARDAVLLICYMLDAKHVDRFPRFVSALYFFLCRGDLSPNNVKATSSLVFSCWKDAVGGLPFAVHAISCQAAMKVATQYSRDAWIAGQAVGAGTDDYVQYAAQLSVYWHAAFAAAAFAAAAAGTDTRPDAPNKEAMAIMELIPYPTSLSASWSCWEPLLGVLRTILPRTDLYTFIIVRTPPALAGDVLQSAVITTPARLIIATFWLTLQTLHIRNVLEALPAMLNSCSPRHICFLLKELPIRTRVQISSDSTDQILAHFTLSNRNRAQIHRADCEDSTENRNAREDGDDGGHQNSEGSSGVQLKIPSTDAEITAGHAATDMRATGTSNVLLRHKRRAPSLTMNGFMPTALCRLLPLRRSVTDLPESIIAYFFSSPAITRSLSLVINDMATERPVKSCLTLILQCIYDSDKVCDQLMAIFGRMPRADESAELSYQLRPGRPANKCCTPHDYVWGIHENGRAHLQNLSPFFFRQVLLRLVQFVCCNMYKHGYHENLSALAHLLSVGWFREWMAALESAMARISTELQGCAFRMQRWAAEFQLEVSVSALQLDGTAPAAETYYLIPKKWPGVALPLSLVEQRMQALRPESPFTVRTYIAIVTSLEQLAVTVMGYPSQIFKKAIYVESVQCLLDLIMPLCAVERPFKLISVAEASVFTATSNAFQQTQIPSAFRSVSEFEVMFKVAMYYVCHFFLLALNDYQNNCTAVKFCSIRLWTNAFLWFFNHPLAQRHLAQAVIAVRALFEKDLACIMTDITSIQSDILGIMAHGPENAYIDTRSLAQYLIHLCAALKEGEVKCPNN